MGSVYYDPGQQRAAKVNDLFTRIATRYDLVNDLQSFGLHRLWKRDVIRLARVQPGARALDVCCGTGDITIGLAGHDARVIGLDFSQRMLEVARERIARASVRNSAHAPAAGASGRIALLRGDALNLPFRDACFDIVTIGYGLRNLTDWQTGLEEMARVLKPGGRIVALEFGKPENRLWRAIYFGYLRWHSPLLGYLVCGDAGAYAYILESLQHYPAQQGVLNRMRAMGLANARVFALLGGVMSINFAEKP